MMNVRTVAVAMLACSAIGSARLDAQRGFTGDTIIVRTIPLAFLSNGDAAKLVAPYVPVSENTGVFGAGGAVHAITVKARSSMMARIDSLIRANDHASVTIRLRLQIIAASDSAIHDASIGDVDSELRNLFRFNGYRLLSQNVIQVMEDSPFQTIMRGPAGDPITVAGGVEGFLRGGGKSVQLHVDMSHDARTAQLLSGQVQTGTMHQELLHTGLSIPLGQTVVVGSAMTSGSTPAIILTVRPELTPVKP